MATLMSLDIIVIVIDYHGEFKFDYMYGNNYTNDEVKEYVNNQPYKWEDVLTILR